MTLTIAIDGPAGSGKSSVSKEAARRLSYGYLDTGAAYRALAWHTLARGADTADEAAVIDAACDFPYAISLDADDYWVRVGDTDVTALTGARERRAFHRRTQLVYQNPGASLDPRQTILDAVAEPLANFGLEGSAAGRRGMVMPAPPSPRDLRARRRAALLCSRSPYSLERSRSR